MKKRKECYSIVNEFDKIKKNEFCIRKFGFLNGILGDQTKKERLFTDKY